jgi:hypothetical protein
MSSLIFQYTWRAILEGDKSMTRRIVKPNELGNVWNEDGIINEVLIKRDGKQSLCKWCVGKTYAAMTGRGKPAAWWREVDGRIETNIPQYDPLPKPWNDHGVRETLAMHGFQQLRVKITAIRQERLQDITEADAVAEGCSPVSAERLQAYESARDTYAQLWDSINTRKGTRWADNPRVWALTFEVA